MWHNHYGIVISTQYYKDLPPSVWSNLTHILLYADLSEKTLESIFEEKIKTKWISWDFFLQIYQAVTSEPHNFLYINCDDPSDIWMNYDYKIIL